MTADLARGLVGTLVIPPISLMLAALVGGIAALRGARTGGWLAVVATVALLFLATPLASGLLVQSLASDSGPAPSVPPAAILVFGAETVGEPASADPGPLTLERLRRAADLQRETGLPVLVTAGQTTPGAPPLATLMRHTLEQSFHVPVRWVEPAARNTTENAALSAELLAPDGIRAVFVVTHAWHMRRALAAARRAGLSAWPAAVRAERVPSGKLGDWLPRPDHLVMSWLALREWVGLLAGRMGL